MRLSPQASRRRSLLPAGLVLATASAALAPSQAAAAGAPFTCEASVLRATLGPGPAIEPLVANRGKACADSLAGLPNLAAPLPLALKAAALNAATKRTGAADRPDQQQNVAAASIADLSVGSLGSLGLSLPLDQIPLPAQLQTIVVPLPTAPVAGVTAPVTGTIGGIVGGLPLPTGTVPVVPTLPPSVTIDIAAAVRELVKLPSADLLGVKAASALAGASCVAGKPVTAGQRTVAGVSVLGNVIDVDTFGDKPIVDTQMIDPSQIDLSKIKSPTLDALLAGLPQALVDQVNAAVAAAVKALPPVALPIDLLRVTVKPGTQTKTADSLTQTALEVKVTALGMNAVDLVLGEAKVGTAGVDCAPPAPPAAPAPPKPPVVAPPAAPKAAAPAAQAPLACTTRRLVLTDVLRKGSRVAITGVADKRFVGRSVTIRFEADGSTASRATVASNGTFETSARLPSTKLRSSNRARYQAVLGKEKSLNLKLVRRMFVDRLSSANGEVTVVGRVIRPLGTPVQTITLTRRVSCKKSEVVARFKPKADGRFSITVKAPEGQTSSVYRLGTQVRKTVKNRKLFPTFTLPQGVDLKQ